MGNYKLKAEDIGSLALSMFSLKRTRGGNREHHIYSWICMTFHL